MFRFLCKHSFHFSRANTRCWITQWVYFSFLYQSAKLSSTTAVTFHKPHSNVWEIQFLCIPADTWYCQDECFWLVWRMSVFKSKNLGHHLIISPVGLYALWLDWILEGREVCFRLWMLIRHLLCARHCGRCQEIHKNIVFDVEDSICSRGE